MHVVPPPMTRNYMPPKSDFGIDESKITYGPKQSTTSEFDAKTSDLESCESSSSGETLETVPKPVESKSKVVNEPKVWSDAPIIEEYESDSDDENMSKASKEQEKPSCAFINTVNFSHLNRDYDFHEKRMAKQVELNKQKEQEIEEGGDAEEHVEDVTAGDDAQEDVTAAQGDDAQEPSIPSPTRSTPPPQPPQDLPSTSQGRIIDETDKDDVVALMDDKDEDKKDEEAKEDELAEVQEVVDVVTTAKLIIEVVTAASEAVTAASEAVTAASTTISTVEPQVLAAIIIVAPAKVDAVLKEPKPLKKKQQLEMDEEYVRKLHAELNKDIDWDVAIDYVKQKAKEDPAMQIYQVMKKKPQTKAQARKNMIMYLKNVVGFKLGYFKGMSYDDIRPIFEAKFNSNIEFLLKTKE
uniref:Uncharacterized protein n=1 Tax=Tanacetum cinerariifolium TaxID=118510 RepID=A0A699JV35_TANCI|nr:hypothetical protein [Tanacetum cinerariifolium]